MSFLPTRVKTHYTLLKGLSKPEDVAEKCVELGYKSCVITDTASLSGCVDFTKQCKKKKIKPILGTELQLSDNPGDRLSTSLILSKNLDGWRDLISISSASNDINNYHKGPRLNRKQLAGFLKGNNICILGAPNSDLTNKIFKNPDEAYSSTYENIKDIANPDWIHECSNLVAEYQELFGKDNFFLEVLPDSLQVQKDINSAIRYLAKKLGVKCIVGSNSYYTNKTDVDDQRVSLCSGLETTLKNLANKIVQKQEPQLLNFLKSREYYLKSLDELSEFSQEEKENTLLIDSMCESYDIFSKPIFPRFECEDEYELLKELCRKGWKNRLAHISAQDKQIYQDRVTTELEVFKEANLCGYVLIVWDYVEEMRKRGYLVAARGSGAGSLVLYLLGISNADPIKYGLMFERFYNKGRNTKDRVSLPDIDCDFPVRAGEEVINYLRTKYGQHSVAQICTFSKTMGRGSVEDVLRAHEACSFDEMNKITEHIPDEAKIADQLQEMRDLEGESSIVKWSLENNSKELSDWCSLQSDGSLDGRFAKYFAQAIRLEGTKRSQSRHAAGVIIAPHDLRNYCPMIRVSSTEEEITGFDMYALEELGYVKFDVLKVNVLDKIMDIQKLLRTGILE